MFGFFVVLTAVAYYVYYKLAALKRPARTNKFIRFAREFVLLALVTVALYHIISPESSIAFVMAVSAVAVVCAVDIYSQKKSPVKRL